MNIGGILVGGTGLWMMYCSVKNRNPLTAVKDIVTTGKIGDSPITTGTAGGSSGGLNPGSILSGQSGIRNDDGTLKKNAPAILGSLSTGGQVGAAVGGLVGLGDAGRIIGQLDGAAIGTIFGSDTLP